MIDPEIIYQQLENVYTDSEHPASYSSASRLYYHTKSIPGVTLSVVKDYLATKPSYSRHRKRNKKFPRRQIIARQVDDTWQLDIAFMVSLSHSNMGFKYILVGTDVLSGFSWAQPLKRKTGPAVLKGIQTILANADGRKPKKIHSDLG